MIIKQYSMLYRAKETGKILRSYGLGFNIGHAKKVFYNKFQNFGAFINVQPVNGLNQYQVKFNMPCHIGTSLATIFAKTEEEARVKFLEAFEAADIEKVEEKKKGIIKSRELAKMPEIVLARRCFSLGQMMWRINHDAADGRIEDGKHIDDSLKSLEESFDKHREEVQRRILAPKLKNCTVYNLNANFNSWNSAWCSYIYGMTNEEYDVFSALENEYATNGDVCRVFQIKKLPKKYADWKVWDLTDEEWSERITPEQRERAGANVEVKFEK